VFDKTFGVDDIGDWGMVNGATITDNYFGGGFASGGAAASWTRNFARASVEEGTTTVGVLQTQSGCSNSYLLFDDAVSTHTHQIDVLSAAPLPSQFTVTSCIFDP
jgi:hypothetical protein